MKTIFQIVHKYRVLHFDEHPILFFGVNGQNKVIIGSFIDETQEDTLLFFHVIVSNEKAISFLRRNISYVNLMEAADEIAILNKDYNDNIISGYTLKFEDIDPLILPLKDAYCPRQSKDTIEEIEAELLYSTIFNKPYKDLKSVLRERLGKEKGHVFSYNEDVGKLIHGYFREQSHHYVHVSYKQAHGYKSYRASNTHFFKRKVKA